MTTSKLAYEAAFPDGFVTSVNYVVPKELSDIAEKLEALDVEGEDAVAEVRAEIKGIEAGDYTFRLPWRTVVKIALLTRRRSRCRCR